MGLVYSNRNAKVGGSSYSSVSVYLSRYLVERIIIISYHLGPFSFFVSEGSLLQIVESVNNSGNEHAAGRKQKWCRIKACRLF